MTAMRPIIALLVCCAVWTATPAGAADVKDSGKPGSVQALHVYGFTVDAQPLPTCVLCDDVNDYIQNHQSINFAAYTPQRYIWRAPYSGVQFATVEYRLYHKNYCSDVGAANGYCNDGFSRVKTDTGRYTIQAGAPGVWVPEWADYVSANYPEGVSFGMDIYVVWRSATGAFLGSRYIDYNAGGDYKCLTSLCDYGYSSKYGAWINLHS